VLKNTRNNSRGKQSMSQESKVITAYNLYEFTLKIAEAVREGYGLTDTNEGMPQSMGPGYYSCIVVKKEEEVYEAQEREAEASEEKSATQTSPQSTKTARNKKSTTK
jgi:hypothetical protein